MVGIPGKDGRDGIENDGKLGNGIAGRAKLGMGIGGKAQLVI